MNNKDKIDGGSLNKKSAKGAMTERSYCSGTDDNIENKKEKRHTDDSL
ncbi:MAG: hypothetical protein SOV83_06555 [Prevotella sp.]|nr:hypothetical protein [Prevotella sp.]